jgi:hypothetical protein
MPRTQSDSARVFGVQKYDGLCQILQYSNLREISAESSMSSNWIELLPYFEVQSSRGSLSESLMSRAERPIFARVFRLVVLEEVGG